VSGIGSRAELWTFALAVSAGTVSTLRGYRLAPLVWVMGSSQPE
jgi:hypothetical protein